MSTGIFVDTPEPTPKARAIFDEDVAEVGFVMNTTRLWAYQPDTWTALFGTMGRAVQPAGLTYRDRGILIVACAAALGDSYCALAWGQKLAANSDSGIACGVVRGTHDGLSPAERAMAGWARKVAADPAHTTLADVQALHEAGFTDERIFAITVFVALRLAFSTVNNALGARPDAQFRNTAPADLLSAVTFGRPLAD
jgi:uncharacterized peroxidase-related enzyme